MSMANNHLREAETLVNLQTQKYKSLEQTLREMDAKAIEETMKKMKETRERNISDKNLEESEEDS